MHDVINVVTYRQMVRPTSKHWQPTCWKANRNLCLLLYGVVLIIVLSGCSTEWKCSEQISGSMLTMFIKCFWRQESSSSMIFAWKGNCFNSTLGGVLPDTSNGIWCTSTLSTAACHRFGSLTPLLMEQSESPSSCPERLSPTIFHGVIVLVGCHEWEAHQYCHNICETIKIKISVLTKLLPFSYSCKNWSLLYRYNRIKKCLFSLKKL